MYYAYFWELYLKNLLGDQRLWKNGTIFFKKTLSSILQLFTTLVPNFENMLILLLDKKQWWQYMLVLDLLFGNT